MPGLAGRGCPRKADQVVGRLLTPRPQAGRDGRDGGGHRHERHPWRGLIEPAVVCGRLVGQADGSNMGWFTRTEDAMSGTLTEAERIALSRLEATVAAGVTASNAVLEAGKALNEIRSRQLYRDAGTWEKYVETRFRISKRRADQMVSYAGVKAALDEMGTRVPEMSEKAARPLVGLSPDTITEIVAEAAASPDGVTAGSIRKAASRRKAKAKVRVPRPVRLKVAGAVVEVAFNAKGAATGFNVQAALEAAIEAARRQAAEAA
jgi:hypothetical protein